MKYTVKLATFPPWKAPVPYKTIHGAFPTINEAAEAGSSALAPITERELADLAPDLQPQTQRVGEGRLTAINVPERAIHGYLIYDEMGVEMSNWTTLDVAVERAARG